MVNEGLVRDSLLKMVIIFVVTIASWEGGIDNPNYHSQCSCEVKHLDLNKPSTYQECCHQRIQVPNLKVLYLIRL